MAEPENNPLKKVSDWLSSWWQSFQQLRQQVGILGAVLVVLILVIAWGWWNWAEITKRPGIETLIAWIAKPSGPLVDKENLLKNGDFEEDLKFWGTGYYETDVYQGSLGTFWASRVGESITNMKIADVTGEVVDDIHRSGSKSFRISNNSPSEAHIYGSMSQRITGLSKNTDYIASFWIKALRAGRGTFEITTDLEWRQRKGIEPGTYDWKEFSHVFNTGDKTFVDFRILSEEPGAIWVTDIVFNPYFHSK